MTDLAAAIRELHQPNDSTWPTCGGCDSEGWESEAPDWPCRTARLVYTAEEIEQVAQQARKKREAARKEPADTSALGRLVPAIWEQRLADQIKGSEWIMRALNTPPEHR